MFSGAMRAGSARQVHPQQALVSECHQCHTPEFLPAPSRSITYCVMECTRGFAFEFLANSSLHLHIPRPRKALK